MIGIIGAMSEEISAIKLQMENVTTTSLRGRIFYSGIIHEQGVVLVQAGIGKVNAAITTTLLLDHYHVDAVINVGVAGGQHGVQHGDIILSSSVLYHDVDVTNFGKYVHGQVPGHEPEFFAEPSLTVGFEKVLKELHFEYKIGRIASGDQFVYSTDKVQEINKLYDNVFAIEMEACAIAHTASIFQVPFIIVRSISDVLGDDSQAEDFQQFLVSSSDKVAHVIQQYLQEKL
ncbi:5'-methylthioadenosine/adenosylhomocysteine nucleosidase [Candidatus Xianfuyuplasma coldseepsis]|uniref:adenosylhomocysteine nucleosidase n=1 Tax=Candidatus Xianfuyuplasma coldseepsis TaxID=2782163 RepID=A0A7L7KT94_9MOLU|nr:5'-methylthioadenosine/adenosylhomocysteine nucleosidase [Xianfuyuplasma coldseepsis]QMS85619.1 5'-methylthioadenosine/adenosylhomocysteine nucleosidase [Xianfuyuplasma coldseepsis]